MFYYNVRDFKSSTSKVQQKPFGDVFQNRCFQKIHNILRKTLVLKSILNELFKKETSVSCEYVESFKNNFSLFQNTSGGCFYRCSIKSDFLKNCANFTRMDRFSSPFLFSCRPITCNSMKIESLLQVFCCQFFDIPPSNFMQNRKAAPGCEEM